MNIKYVRTKENNIYCNVNDKEIKVGTKWVSYLYEGNYSFYTKKEKIIKTASTLQELIEVGDLVYNNKYYDGFGVIDKNELDDILNHYSDATTKILTPRGKDYICQWEAE